MVLAGLLSAATANPELQPGAPVAFALQYAADTGAAQMIITPGDYNFSSTSLQLLNAASLDIDATGVTFWFSPGGGVQLKGCTDVFIRGLTIDYTPTTSQGVVSSVDLQGGSFTAKFDPTFLLPPCPNAVSPLRNPP